MHQIIRYSVTAAALVSIAPVCAAITYRSVDTIAAIGHGGSFSDGFIRGNASDSNLVALGVPAAFANPNGSLSTTFTSFANPLFNLATYSTLTSTWDNFIVSGSSVSVNDFTLSGTNINTNGFNPTVVTNVATRPHSITANLDGTLQAQFTANFATPGNLNTEIDFSALGAFILNTPDYDTARAEQFVPALGQTGADYLNLVRDNFLPENWTQAGIWLFSDTYTASNIRGSLASDLIGASFIGYNVWYSTDSFLFGEPLPDANNDGLYSIEEVDALVSSGLFPEVAGLNLAGQGFAQIYDVSVIEGDGTLQTFTFNYDESLLAPGEEDLLSIVHFVNGAWETPQPQVLDTIANSITVTVDNFSPFALVAVPLPPALYGFASAAMLLGSRLRKRKLANEAREI